MNRLIAAALLPCVFCARVRMVGTGDLSEEQKRPTVVTHEKGRHLGDAGYRQQELIDRMNAEDYDQRMMQEFYSRQREERDNPYVDPPQGKPWLSQDGLSVSWSPPSYRWGDDVYYLAQIRECEPDGLKGFFGWCGNWYDLYKTGELSCDISGFTRNSQLDPASMYQARVRSCLVAEDLNECKQASRKWSQISEKFKPAVPKPLEPSAEEKRAAHQKELELQLAREAREQRQIKQQQVFEQNRQEQETRMRAEWDRRKNEDERRKWRAQREQERQEEQNYAAAQGNILAHNVVGRNGDNLLGMLEDVGTSAERQEVSKIGNKILVQTYIEGGRNIITEAARIGANPDWLARFKSTLSSSFDLYSTDMSIRMLRNAFRLATDEARKELQRQKQAQEQAQAKAKAEAAARARQNIVQQRYVPNEVTRQADFAIGEIVVLSDNYKNEALCKDASVGPLKKGRRGKVVEIIAGDKPYIVEVIEGSAAHQSWGYNKYAIRRSSRQ